MFPVVEVGFSNNEGDIIYGCYSNLFILRGNSFLLCLEMNIPTYQCQSYKDKVYINGLKVGSDTFK